MATTTTGEVLALHDELTVLAEFLGLTEDFTDTRCGCRPLYQKNAAECTCCGMFGECDARATAIARLQQIRRQLEYIESNKKGGD